MPKMLSSTTEPKSQKSNLRQLTFNIISHGAGSTGISGSWCLRSSAFSLKCIQHFPDDRRGNRRTAHVVMKATTTSSGLSAPAYQASPAAAFVKVLRMPHHHSIQPCCLAGGLNSPRQTGHTLCRQAAQPYASLLLQLDSFLSDDLAIASREVIFVRSDQRIGRDIPLTFGSKGRTRSLRVPDFINQGCCRYFPSLARIANDTSTCTGVTGHSLVPWRRQYHPWTRFRRASAASSSDQALDQSFTAARCRFRRHSPTPACSAIFHTPNPLFDFLAETAGNL